jgi:photosystem II stability/assembly factor-like uncharacterized protein
LCSLHFLNPYTGWIVGREELPYGGGSVGVLLFTQDGGLKWRQIHRNALPGLNRVRFVDGRNGFVAGDGTDQFPTGLFATRDGGRTWKPVPGPRCPGWLAADFTDAETGALAGVWGQLAEVRGGVVQVQAGEPLGGRAVAGLQIVGPRTIAVGQGGLVLFHDHAGGAGWRFPDTRLPTEVRAGWDFRAMHCQGSHIWVAGRPGAVLLHSPDKGQTWETVATRQPLPLNDVFFIDDNRGWVVGELGSILATTDGGKTWRVQQRGGQRAAVLLLHARSQALPVDTIAILGGREGYLAAAARVTAPDAGAAAPARAWEGDRFTAAVRLAGGAAGEMIWQFPLPQHLARADKKALLKSWDLLHADRATEELLRQLVLALRVWRPEVVITDNPDAEATGSPVEALVAEAVHEAFGRAADPKAFPEQLTTLGLEPWRAAKLYGRWEGRTGAQVVMDLTDPSPRLEATPRDYATPAFGLLTEVPWALPDQRFFRLLDSRLEGADGHRDLMQGVALAPRGVARRDLGTIQEPGPEILQAVRTRRNLEAVAENAGANLADPSQVLAQIGPALKKLPDDQGAAAAFAVANHYAHIGQWEYAREIFLLMVDRYPAHPLAADAYRWLIRHNSSSEARRRHELGQFLVMSQVSFQTQEKSAKAAVPDLASPVTTIRGGISDLRQQNFARAGDRIEARQWYQGCLDVGARLAAFGPLFATDPSVQFCLQSARRNLGDFEAANQWYSHFRNQHADGPWRDAAAAELWLTNRVGPPPKPVALCRPVSARPYLDGRLDEACWTEGKPLKFGNAVGDTAREYPTEAWLAFDKEFLYLALRCRHPADRHVPLVQLRPRDADLRSYDRVSLLLDLDRDYATYFQLQIDQRGCVCEDCWGDRTWNPRWFVAAHSDQTSWQIEAAIPLAELTGDNVTAGKAWACNLVRVLPGRGVQAWSLPADVQPRPEGMGLLLFGADKTDKR